MAEKLSKKVLEILEDSICKDCENLVIREHIGFEPIIVCPKWVKIDVGFARVNNPISNCTFYDQEGL